MISPNFLNSSQNLHLRGNCITSSSIKFTKIVFLLTQELEAPIREDDIKLNLKSSLAFDLDEVFSTFFTNLTGEADEDLLIECFVETKESRIADFSLEKMTARALGNLDPNIRKCR